MRNRYVLLADIFSVALGAFGAYAIRFGWFFVDAHPEFVLFLGLAIALKIPVFFLFGLYQRYWRYAGFWDLIAVGLANSAASILFGLVMVGLVLFGAIDGFPRSVPPIDWLLCLTTTTGVRASVRALAETIEQRLAPAPALATRRVLVVGAGDAGSLVVREMQRNPHVGMNPVGFLDDDPGKRGKQIYGVPVLGSVPDLPAIVQKIPIAEVVIAMPTAGGDTLRSVVNSCQAHGVPAQVMPGIYELLDRRFTVSRLRKVDISDLLRRPQVTVRADAASYLRDGTVVVTGAGGSIGSELCFQLAHNHPGQIVLVGHGENSIFHITAELQSRFPNVRTRPVIADVRDRDRIERIFRAVRPDIVFHAAAHKHVPLMEENVCEAITNNVAGTRHVIDAAIETMVPRLVLISTDKAAAPHSVMGASKRLAEMLVRKAAHHSGHAYVVVRFGNVLGSRGSVVPTFREQIERGGPVTVTHPEVRRYFMTAPEAVHLVLEAAGIGHGGELFVLDMGDPVLLRDLAADMIRLSGLTSAEVPIAYTGLRAGEKLEESLWETGATVTSSEERDIHTVTEASEVRGERLDNLTDRLLEAAKIDDQPRIFSLLAECIPTAHLTQRTSVTHRNPDNTTSESRVPDIPVTRTAEPSQEQVN